MCAALFLNFHGSQGLSAPLQRARSPENLQHSGCYHRVDRNMIHFTYRHFQRDYSCRVHGTLSVSHWLLWQARVPHRRIAPASASCDANLSMAILSHGTDGCQHITSILFISVYPFMLCIFRARGKTASPLAKAGGIPPLIYGQPERAAARRRFGDLSTPILFQTRFWLPHFSSRIAPGGRAFARPPLVVDVLLVGAQLSILVPTPWLVGWYVPFVAPVQPVRISLGWLK